jgi:hypothetical protein
MSKLPPGADHLAITRFPLAKAPPHGTFLGTFSSSLPRFSSARRRWGSNSTPCLVGILTELAELQRVEPSTHNRVTA